MNTRIKDLRTKYLKEKGINLTQKEFAERVGLSENYIWMIEKGTRTPAERTISDICNEFGCNEVWLRTGEGEPFQGMTKEEEIMRFAAQTVKSSDEFRKTLVFTLAKLSPEDWKNLANIFAAYEENHSKTE